MAEAAPYPVTFEAVYPERLSRLSTFFRLLLSIPVLIFGSHWGYQCGPAGLAGHPGAGPHPAMAVYFQVALNRWFNRTSGYLLLLTDRYPPFEGDWVISYEVRYPERLARWKLLFWKVITAIPHFIILLFLGLGAMIVTVIAWFFILFAGRYPRGLFEYVAGVMRWSARVQAYGFP